jgi:hypothetical protein
MPNMLTIIHEKPELIVAIVSQDQKDKLPQLDSAVTELFMKAEHKPRLETSYVVDAFKRDDIYRKCQLAVEDHPGFDWIFNITAATTIMSIGAYEAAKELASKGKTIRCWYLDTAHTNVVSLVGEDSDESIFDLKVDQYAAVYNCRLVPGILEDQRRYCQDHWIRFSQFLVKHPHYIDLLKEVLKHIYPKPAKPSKGAGSRTYSISPATSETWVLLEEAYNVGLLNNLQRNDNAISLKLSYTQANFLDGPWLEAYVWNEAHNLKLFSDCQWNQWIVDEKKPDDRNAKNELDVSMIYKAQLIIAECKTGVEAFDTETLYKLDSVASPLGGRFVGKILVTSQSAPNGKEHNKQNKYEDFQRRADERGIVLVTREELYNIGEIIEKQVKHPKHARI